MDNQKSKKQNQNKEDIVAIMSALQTEASSILSQVKKAIGSSGALKKSLLSSQNVLKAKQAEEEAKKIESQKPKVEEAPVVVVEKKAEVQQQPKAAVQKPQSQAYQNRNFDRSQSQRPRQPYQNNGPRQGAVGEARVRTRNFGEGSGQRPFGQNGERRSYGQSAQGQRPSFQQTSSRPAAPAVDLSAMKAKTNTKQTKKKSSDKGFEEKKTMNRKALMNRGFVADESLIDEDGYLMGSRKLKNKKAKAVETYVAPKIEHAVITTENLTVKLLAEKLGKPVVELIKKFMILGVMVNINSNVDFDSAELVASEFGITLEQKLEKTYEEKLFDISSVDDKEEDLTKRPPVVTVLGHVDHGKTSLLDYIRNTNIISGEAGGITQHIGAYTITKNDELITFIDTPGHAAFAAMRERGAKLTDIAILVVAADDGVMPQTIEAIKYIKESKVPMVVAVNKIDKPEANIDRIKQQLSEHDVVPEEWGGDAILIPISAKTGQNVDKLLEMVLFVAEYQNLRANPNRQAIGSVIEARLDKGMGPLASILVQNGTLHVGDVIIAGMASGKVRAMLDQKGKHIKSAGPSIAVSVLGLSSVPNAGDEMYAVDEKLSKKILSERVGKEKIDKIKTVDNSIDSLMNRMKETEYKNYNVIVKADVQGSVEAINSTLSEIMNDEVKVRCIHGGVGAVNENDVMLASASNAIIVAFNVKTDFKAKVLSEKYKVQIKNYRIIYEIVDYVTEQIGKMVTPKYKEVISGHAEIRMIFKASKVGAIAGCYITDGKLTKGQQIRITRKGKEIHSGNIATIQREKNEVKEILSGFECGIVIQGFSAFEVGDVIEGINQERIN